MKRGQYDQDGSLELLLDTICNTFGGVLFISIFVVLLLNMSSNQAASTPPSEDDQEKLIEGEARLAQTNDEIERLMQAIRSQEQIEHQIVDVEIRDRVGRLRQVQQRNAERVKRKTDELTKVTRDQRDINQLTTEITQSQEMLRSAQQNLSAIDRQLRQEIESRTRAAKLPKAHGTEKLEIPMFLRAGRLCTYVRATDAGLVVNDAEIVERQDDADQTYIEPKEGAGIVVNLEGEVAELDRGLLQFDSGEHYLAVFVWPDSFAHFAILKDRMVANQFEYRLEPFPEDQKIRFGANEQAIRVQ